MVRGPREPAPRLASNLFGFFRVPTRLLTFPYRAFSPFARSPAPRNVLQFSPDVRLINELRRLWGRIKARQRGECWRGSACPTRRTGNLGGAYRPDSSNP